MFTILHLHHRIRSYQWYQYTNYQLPIPTNHHLLHRGVIPLSLSPITSHIDIMTSSRLLLFASAVAIMSSSSIPAKALSSMSPKPKCLIKICHNKDCTKSGGGEQLLKMFRDLLPGESDSDRHMIESSGCLSQW